MADVSNHAWGRRRAVSRIWKGLRREGFRARDLGFGRRKHLNRREVRALLAYRAGLRARLTQPTVKDI